MLYLTTKPEAKKLDHNNDLLHASEYCSYASSKSNPLMGVSMHRIKLSNQKTAKTKKKKKAKKLKDINLSSPVVASLNV